MKILVNLITIFRLAFTFVLIAIKNKISDIAFILNVIILFLTDSIDGILARKFKVQTIFGSTMDTIADKVLCISLYLVLIDKQRILMLILICEILIALINIIAQILNRKTKSSVLGKTKMWFVGITIVLAYLSSFNVLSYMWVIISTILTFILEIATIINYIITLCKQKKNKRHKIENLKELKVVLFDTEYYLSTL